MVLLIAGVVLWSTAHLIKSVARPFRARLIESLGAQPYQGLFALTIVASIAMMVFGWRSTPPVPVWGVPGWGRAAAFGLMLPALVLFIASGVPTNIKRFIRHPQLTGVAVWSAGHLLANGESRSIVLFGGIGLWALVAMVTISRRDGAWQRPEPTPIAGDLKPLVAGVAAYAVLLFVHRWLAGVPLV